MDNRIKVAKFGRNLLDHCLTDPNLRLKKTAFNHQRGLGTRRLLLILLHRLAVCLQLAIDIYLKSILLENNPHVRHGFFD